MLEGTLKRIDQKLTAILALLARQATPELRTLGVEAIARRGGLATAEIAVVLNKSQRSIQQALKQQGYKD